MSNLSKQVKWKIDANKELPLAVIEDTEEGQGVCEFGAYTQENVANAKLIVELFNEALKSVNFKG